MMQNPQQPPSSTNQSETPGTIQHNNKPDLPQTLTLIIQITARLFNRQLPITNWLDGHIYVLE
jgi:hypothetical protein